LKNILRSSLFLVLAAGMLSPALFADTISLKNGDRLTGTIEKSDAKTLILKTEFAGEITVQWSAIDSINSAQPLHVGLSGGQMVDGPVTTKDGQIQVATTSAGVVTAAKDSVQVIRSDAEQAAYDAAIERLRHPHLADYWSGTLDTGLSVTRGNSSTLSYTFAGHAVRATDRDKVSAYATAVYGKTDIPLPAEETAHQITGGVRGDINVSPRWFAFAATDFNSNALQHLDLQNVVDGGAGGHVIKTKNAQFDVFAGFGYNQEYFGSYLQVNPTPPPATNTIAPVTQKNAEFNAGETFDAKMGSRSSVTETFNYFPNLTGPSGYRFTFNTVLSTAISKWLGWQFSLTDNFLSNPPDGIKGNDLLISTGLRVTFGNPK
jgi:putative salt-induced outer membrane protein